ncbi:asparagine synthase (glutamine-hydrolysing) [Knoellia remsis]|uniref:asparagine synthase (glutamine-hydrolyzing) n=1 Tax=Knoellia remsis TaxID=407159 RepID=A0A2T0UQ61_9MICO|nr:asparagine synthase-related protein [Knoellia remsis]PRY60061.1 asparagine synthase (glutamine-hydrolysing) [Knoellia remsis]
MSGIAGHHGPSASEALLATMNAAQAHRGPDGEGIVVDGPAGLAQRAGEPFTSADGRFVVVVDGEVDAQGVAEAFARDGRAAFAALVGGFAVAIWDRDQQRLTLARDPFGIAPLHVCRVPASAGSDAVAETLLFASEIGPILECGLVEKQPNERVIHRYLTSGAVDDGPETFFEGIERLQPGEVLEADADGIRRSMFSRLREELVELAREQRPYDRSVAAELRDRLAEAVRRRVPSGAPVGTDLTDGLASAVVAGLVAETASSVGAQPNSFDVTFPEEGASASAADSAATGGAAVHTVSPTASDLKADLRDFVRTHEEPLPSAEAYVEYQLMRDAAAKGVRVLFGAAGADEELGDPTPQAGRVDQLRSRVTSAVRRRKDVPETSLLGRDFRGRFAGETASAVTTDLRQRLVAELFETTLPARLRATDRNAARFGVAARAPYLDRDVVRLVFGLADDALTDDGATQRVLRDAAEGLVPEATRRRQDASGPAAPQAEWFMRLKNHFYSIFLSEPFANRPYVDQTEVLHAFEGWIKGTNTTDAETFWRLVNLELWLEEFFDEGPVVDKATVQAAPKADTDANAGKQLDLTTELGETVRRYPLRTELFAKGDDLDAKVLARIDEFFETLPAAGPEHDAATQGRWYLFISEKIIAITQGRSYFIWDIKVGRPARVLSKYVTRTPAGIGLGSPFTMQLAIQEAGLPRVLYAAAGGAVGKAIGRKGLFYELVGNQIAAIDGPTEYSAYPSNVSAKLAPKDPDEVAARLSAGIRDRVPSAYKDTFAGTIVMDANDIGRNVLGSDVPDDGTRFEAMFADNPLGQGSEQTPMALVFIQDT